MGVVVACVLALSVTMAGAQATDTPPKGAPPQAVAPPRPPAAPDVIPIEVQVVISRYRDDKKTSSLPYTLAINANEPGQTRLRMGAEVAVPATVYTPQTAQDKGAAVSPLTSYNYKSVGTNIDCSARSASDGRFSVTLMVSESSAVSAEPQAAGTPRVPNAPIFGNFQTNTTLLLRDGQTRQFTAATDRITGEVVRVDVTLRVLK
jgi:hypothetical protein